MHNKHQFSQLLPPPLLGFNQLIIINIIATNKDREKE